MVNKKKIKNQIIDILKNYPELKKAKVFLFGSFLQKEKFFDIDLGISGKYDEKILGELKEYFEESNFPYKVDIIDFNKAEKDFKNYVLKQKILCLKF